MVTTSLEVFIIFTLVNRKVAEKVSSHDFCLVNFFLAGFYYLNKPSGVESFRERFVQYEVNAEMT